jgi:ATP adenylyltransferase
MVATSDHKTQFLELTRTEIIHIFRTIQGLQLLLNELYNPKGFNIGINQSKDAGGSIDHLHFHIVPRYGSELGFVDIVAETRVLPEGLESVKKKIEQNIHKYLNEKFFKNF